jgi:CRP-like cAMP-binding protein
VDEHAEVISYACAQRFLPRKPIVREGDFGLKVFLLASGRVKMTQVSRTGQEVILRIRRSGDVVGGLGMSAGETHSSSSVALEPCEVLLWDSRIFESFCERIPALRRNAMRILSSALQVMEECFCELATHRVAPRLARTVLRLFEQSGNPKRVTPISLTCEELGQMTGTTLFTVSRLLCKWAELGLIHPEHKTISIKDFQGLIAIAEGEEVA